MRLTPEKIASLSEFYEGKGNVRFINDKFRAQDESHKWPINGTFNVTERAIRSLRDHKVGLRGLEYALALDAKISEIVNKQV